MSVIISVENLSKVYRLGQLGTGTFTNDLKVWWANKRGKPNPLLRIGQFVSPYRDSGELWALRDINFTVEQGEVLGIIGRNGAGKSTLLKILSRVTAPTTGQIKVRGRVASLLEVGTGFHPELTGRENIYLNGAILGMSRNEIRRKFDEIVNFAEVEKFIDTPVKRYSSGMYVRLAFAVAAHLEPEILVVDEVLAVGDAEFQKKCLGKMGIVAKEGRTVLFVSHNLGAVQQLCSHGIVLSEGTLAYSGKTKTAIDNYLYYIKAPDRQFQEKNLELLENNQITIKNFYFTDENGNTITSIRSGDSFTIHLVLHSRELFRNLIVSLGINDSYATRVTILHSDFSGYTLAQTKNITHVKCVVKYLNLLPGNYSFDVKIYKGKDSIYWAPNSLELVVVSGDVSRTGKVPPKEWGGFFFLDQMWAITE